MLKFALKSLLVAAVMILVATATPTQAAEGDNPVRQCLRECIQK